MAWSKHQGLGRWRVGGGLLAAAGGLLVVAGVGAGAGAVLIMQWSCCYPGGLVWWRNACRDRCCSLPAALPPLRFLRRLPCRH